MEPPYMETKPPPRNEKCLKKIWALFSEYCENSSIHGLKYLGRKELHWFESFLRLFWAVTLISSVCIFAFLTMNIWWKWQNDLIIVSYTDKSTHVYEIPFPMVTICPKTKPRQSVFNFTEIYWKAQDSKNLTQEELERLRAFSLICDTSVSENKKGFNNPTSDHRGMNYANGDDLYDIFDEIMPQFETTILNCRWGNEHRDCGKLFSKYLTEEGICYSFNALNPLKDLTDDLIFNTELPKDKVENPKDPNGNKYPYIVRGLGARNGLQFHLSVDADDHDFLCSPTQGFKIMLNIPGEVPQPLKRFIHIPKGYTVSVVVTPKIIETSYDLKSYKPKRRRCYFDNERKLRYFHTYTQNNCELECLSNFTFQKCGCVKFSMPRHAGVPVCGSFTSKCVYEAEDELSLVDFFNDIEKSSSSYRCSCLPSCNSVVYEAELTFRKTLSMMLGNTSISLFFVDKKVTTTERYRESQISNIVDFMADFGSLLSLFMGFSTLSFVEIVYYLTVRLIINLFKRDKN